MQRERLRAQVLQAHRMGNQLGYDRSPDPEIAHRMAVPARSPPPDCITAAGLGVSVDSVSGGAGARRRWARFAVMAPPAVASAGSPIPPDALTAELRRA